MNFDLSSALAAIAPGRPLVVTDADGVILATTAGLVAWLARRGLKLAMTSYRYEGAIFRADDGSRVLDVEATALIDEFREDLDWLPAVTGACEALAALSRVASIAVLSNVNVHQAKARLRNFAKLGLAYPLIANDCGAGYLADKGAAMHALAAHARAQTFFIDDIPSNLAAVGKAAPQVALVHLVESEPLRQLIGNGFSADCFARTWTEAKNFILGRL